MEDIRKNARELASDAKQNLEELTELLNESEGIEALDDTRLKRKKGSSEASKKWEEKVGIKAKSYKLKTDIAEQFAAACKAQNKSQAEVLMILMSSYIALTRPTEIIGTPNE